MRISFRPGLLLGAGLTIPWAWKAVIWVLDWKSRFDAGVSIMNAPLTLSDWLYLIGLIVGVVLIAANLRGRRKVLVIELAPLSIAISVTAISFVAIAAVWGYYFYDEAQGPIVWRWTPNSPIATSMGTGEPLWVDGFQFFGKNRADYLIKFNDAFVKSEITGEVFHLNLGGQGVQISGDEKSIRPNSTFILVTLLPSTTPPRSNGIFAAAFREKFKIFTFVFKYADGQEYTRRFNESDVDKNLYRAEQANLDALRPRN
jgi:hypothetical protein